MKKPIKYLMLICAIAVLFTGCDKLQEEKQQEAGTVSELTAEEVKSGAETASRNIDIAIVMDASGSMLASDRERIAVEAAKMFIDMEKANGTQVSVVEFSDSVKSEGMINITDQEAKEFLKNVLNNIIYVNQAHTDTGAALIKAVEELKQTDPEHKKAILLFTDGRTEITSGERTIEQSRADIDVAIEAATSMECPIYTVGLNNNGKVDENELTRMSVKTGGLTLIANDVNELPRFFNEIFKTLGNIEEIPVNEITANGEYQSVDISIENDSILEANIVMLSNMQIQDVRLYSPGGEEVPKDGGKAIFTSSSKYSVVKMLTPQSGTWRLEVKGISGDLIKVSLLYNYNINMITQVSQSEARKGDVIQIGAYLTNEGSVVNDKAFYEKLTARADVTCVKTGKTTEVPLIFEENQMKGDFKLPEVTDLKIKVHLEGQGLYRDSDEIVVKASNLEVIQVKKLSPLHMKKNESGEINLLEYFEDPDEETLNFRVVSSDDTVVNALTEESVLYYNSGEKVGEAEIAVEVSDEAGDSMRIILNASVNTFLGRYKFPILGVAAVFVLMVLLLAVREMRKKASGYFLISLSSRSVNEYGGVENSIYSLATGISVMSLGRKFTLKNLLKSFAAGYANVTYDEEKVGGLKQKIDVILSKADGVKFVPTKDTQRMTVRITGSDAAFCDIAGNMLSDMKSQSIACGMSNPTTFYVRINTGDNEKKCVLITIQYKMLAV